MIEGLPNNPCRHTYAAQTNLPVNRNPGIPRKAFLNGRLKGCGRLIVLEVRQLSWGESFKQWLLSRLKRCARRF
jgi:hypothetical protein